MANTRPATLKPSLTKAQFVKQGETKPLVRGRTAPEGFSRLTVNLPKELHKSLKLRAVQDDRNISDIVQSLLADYLVKK